MTKPKRTPQAKLAINGLPLSDALCQPVLGPRPLWHEVPQHGLHGVEPTVDRSIVTESILSDCGDQPLQASHLGLGGVPQRNLVCQQSAMDVKLVPNLLLRRDQPEVSTLQLLHPLFLRLPEGVVLLRSLTIQQGFPLQFLHPLKGGVKQDPFIAQPVAFTGMMTPGYTHTKMASPLLQPRLRLSPVHHRQPLPLVVSSARLREREGQEVYLWGWKVTSKRTTTVDDEPMCFVTLSDEYGRFVSSFFPEVYARSALELVRGMGPFLVKGQVEISFGVAEVVASHVKLLAARPAASATAAAPQESGTGRGNSATPLEHRG